MKGLHLAKKEELPRLTRLWQECFSDSPSEIRAFWKALFSEIRVYTTEKQEAMLCALPLTLVDEEGEAAPAAYLYAVCTAAAARNRGLCRALMAYGENDLKKEGFAFTCLVPSEASLFSFYEALGYRIFDRQGTLEGRAAEKKGSCRSISPEEYRMLRQMQLYGNFIDYPLPLLAWEKTSAEARGGGLYRIETQEGIFCAACEVRDGRLTVRELLPPHPHAAALLAADLGFQSFCLLTEEGTAPFAMGKALGARPLPAQIRLPFPFD